MRSYTVFEWMHKKLGLSGTDEKVFAFIYGASQIDNQEFRGTVGEIADIIGSCYCSVSMSLKRLTEKGLLVKSVPCEDERRNKFAVNAYSVNRELLRGVSAS
ncbi:MAG: MarR family transcriptional regulator [Clostridiales bacterium]|nr:MarR family transcriptional regulator [Clostridiales bacterium]